MRSGALCLLSPRLHSSGSRIAVLLAILSVPGGSVLARAQQAPPPIVQNQNSQDQNSQDQNSQDQKLQDQKLQNRAEASRPGAQPRQPADSPVGNLQPGTIHGLVRSREGAAYEGVSVQLTQGSAPSRSTTSDSAGQFAFADVSPGPFILTLSSGGFVSQQITGSLNPGQAYEIPPAVLLMSNTSSEVRVSASQVEIAQEQLHEEETQRALGIIPNFYVVYDANPAPLKATQKFHLAYRSLVDPMTFVGSAISAGIKQEENEPKGFGQGFQGFALRYAADYGDNLIGTFLGSALLPSVLHQDPRYFYKGTGTFSSRFFYAVANAVVCKSDRGTWQPNYSGLVGNLASQGISQLYYPAEDRIGAGEIFENFAIGKASDAVQNVLQEFVVRHFTHHLPPIDRSQP